LNEWTLLGLVWLIISTIFIFEILSTLQPRIFGSFNSQFLIFLQFGIMLTCFILFSIPLGNNFQFFPTLPFLFNFCRPWPPGTVSFRRKCMFYSFRFLDLDHLPIKKFLLMHTYKFEDENQAMYCPLDIEVTIKSLK
jgi:hypothetical protein